MTSWYLESFLIEQVVQVAEAWDREKTFWSCESNNQGLRDSGGSISTDLGPDIGVKVSDMDCSNFHLFLF